METQRTCMADIINAIKVVNSSHYFHGKIGIGRFLYGILN